MSQPPLLAAGHFIDARSLHLLMNKLRNAARDSLEMKDTILCQLEPYRIGLQPCQLSDWSQPIALVPVPLVTDGPDMGQRYTLNRAELHRYMRLANIQMLPKRMIEDPIDALSMNTHLNEAEIISIALDFTGWHGVFTNLEGNPIYCGRQVASSEAKQALLEVLHSMLLGMEDLLRCLALKVNQALARGTDHGQIQCAIMILSRFVNSHKRQTRATISDLNGEAMYELEEYAHQQIQLVLRQMQLFRRNYGAHFCSVKEKHLQHWIELIKLQSKRSSLVNITLEKQSSWNLGHTTCPWLGSRSFTQILKSQLSPLEEELATMDQRLQNKDNNPPRQIKYRGKSRARHQSLFEDSPLPDSLSKERLKKLDTESCHPGNPLYFTSFVSRHNAPSKKTKEPTGSNHTLFPPKSSPCEP
ncbi:hypothetical protein DL98DRAFT_582928 [Cadophora sp. DSE1049]|nr:hypothetical protein DL98DRAFT_582928 [Cadophora sp. DSE1049]